MQNKHLMQCQEIWRKRGFVPLADIYSAAGKISRDDQIEDTARCLTLAFNGGRPVQSDIARAARLGDSEARLLEAFLRARGIDHAPCSVIRRDRARELEEELIAGSASYIAGLGVAQPYPSVTDDECLAFEGEWARETLAQSRKRFSRFIAGRRSETAVLVGNGPSLAKIDYEILKGQDVYISNYAIRDAWLHRLARGVAVSNRFVARQEPHVFQTTQLWKFHPLWLGDILADSPETVYLNALGGELFFSPEVTEKIAWHSTVTFFWLQILYTAGYRKVCLIGVDNAYHQQPGVREGDLIEQTEIDENHFDSNYFRGKIWQAADTGKMAETYRLARRHYEADGREIVNCTIGGRLEEFRRAALADELPAQVTEESGDAKTWSADDLVVARRDAVLAAARVLTGQGALHEGTTGCNRLDPDDPARRLVERVATFIESI